MKEMPFHFQDAGVEIVLVSTLSEQQKNQPDD